MGGVSDFAVVYDISSDAERAKVDKTLKDFGFRVQKSVFECRLNRKGISDLIARLEGIEIKTGFVKVYRLEYTSKNKVIGVLEKGGIDDGPAYIL